MTKKGPYLFAEIVHADKIRQREELEQRERIEQEQREEERRIEKNRQKRSRQRKAQFIHNVANTIFGLIGVGAMALIMLLLRLVF